EIVLLAACTGISSKSPSNSQQQQQASKPTVQISASPMQVQSGQAATLSWSASDATSVSINGIGTVKAADSLPVSPKATTTYTITATNNVGSVTDSVKVNVNAPAAGLDGIEHIIWTLQENRSFDSYFGRLAEYQRQKGMTPDVEELPLGVKLTDKSKQHL